MSNSASLLATGGGIGIVSCCRTCEVEVVDSSNDTRLRLGVVGVSGSVPRACDDGFDGTTGVTCSLGCSLKLVVVVRRFVRVSLSLMPCRFLLRASELMSSSDDSLDNREAADLKCWSDFFDEDLYATASFADGRCRVGERSRRASSLSLHVFRCLRRCLGLSSSTDAIDESDDDSEDDDTASLFLLFVERRLE